VRATRADIWLGRARGWREAGGDMRACGARGGKGAEEYAAIQAAREAAEAALNGDDQF